MSLCCINRHLTPNDSLWCGQCESLVAGARIGDFTIVSCVGRGTTSVIYKAYQHSLNNRKVVIKVLQSMESQESINVFRREATLLAALVHPYIVPIYAHGIIPEFRVSAAGIKVYSPFLVLPYAEQGSIDVLFAREGGRPWQLQRVVPIIEEAAEALYYAHSQGILHRDVKPANMLMIGSHVVLSDFGVASLIGIENSHLTAEWAGSPAYMAPEVWRLRPGRYSDQYALAVTCFRLLSGEYPWSITAENVQVWLRQHQHTEPRLLSECRPDLPVGVSQVLRRALAKDPHARYPDVREFAIDLRVASENTQMIRTVRRTRVIAEKQVSPAQMETQQEYHGEQRPIANRPPTVQHTGKVAETPRVNSLAAEVHRPTPTINVPDRPPERQIVRPEVIPMSTTNGQRATPVTPEPQVLGEAVLPAINAPRTTPNTQRVVPERQTIREEVLNGEDYRMIPDMENADTSIIEEVKPDLWTWRACWLHVLLYAALSLVALWSQGILIGLMFMLCLWPSLLIGPLVARLFRRVSLSSLYWGILFGMLFGIVDVAISTLVCSCFSALIYTILPGSGTTQPDHSMLGFINALVTISQHAVPIFLVSLWCIVFGGALIGLFAARRELLR